jgi:hypothetical protein
MDTPSRLFCDELKSIVKRWVLVLLGKKDNEIVILVVVVLVLVSCTMAYRIIVITNVS